MSSLKKKLYQFTNWEFDIEKVENLIYDNKVYKFYDNETKKSFLFHYNTNHSLKYNLNILKELIIENFGFCEIVGCKFGKKFIRCKEYENCSHICFYSLYCDKYNIFDLFDNHIPHID